MSNDFKEKIASVSAEELTFSPCEGVPPDRCHVLWVNGMEPKVCSGVC